MEKDVDQKFSNEDERKREIIFSVGTETSTFLTWESFRAFLIVSFIHFTGGPHIKSEDETID